MGLQENCCIGEFLIFYSQFYNLIFQILFWSVINFYKSCFANFKSRGALFSKIMPNFCTLHAVSIYKLQQLSWNPLYFFDKIKLILYPQVRDSMTQLTLPSITEYQFNCKRTSRPKPNWPPRKTNASNIVTSPLKR